MAQSKAPLWKKSMLQRLNLYDIRENLYEILENGDMYGYDSDKSGYYQDYKELFDELAAGACSLLEALDEFDVSEHWDDMTVCLLGYQQTVLGYDTVEADYYYMLDPYHEEFAVEEAQKRLNRLTKKELVRLFRKVMVVLVSFFDIKAAHDCLTAIVDELDERGALLQRQMDSIILAATQEDNKKDKPRPILPQRMWVE